MSVTDNDNKVTYTGDGSKTTPFDFDFKVYSQNDIEVYVAEVLKTISTDYSISLVDDGSEGFTGTVTFVTAPANGAEIVISRALDYTQPDSLPTEGEVPAKRFEKMVDRIAILSQQLKETLSRAWKVPVTFVGTFDATLPVGTGDAGKAVVINATNDGLDLSDSFPALASAAAASASAASASASAAAASAASAAAIAGISGVASVQDAQQGTSTSKIMSADAAAALWENGGNATWGSGTLTIPTTGGKSFTMSGIGFNSNVTALSLNTSYLKLGREIEIDVVANGSSNLLVHNGTSLIVPGGASITMATGDTFVARCIDATNNYWRVTRYTKADGTPVVAAASATQAEMEAASSTTVAVTPGRVKYNPGVVKAWVLFSSSSTTTITSSLNISSLTDNGTGDTSIAFTTAFSSANYAFLQGLTSSSGNTPSVSSIDTGTAPTGSGCRVRRSLTSSTPLFDSDLQSLAFLGDQ